MASLVREHENDFFARSGLVCVYAYVVPLSGITYVLCGRVSDGPTALAALVVWSTLFVVGIVYIVKVASAVPKRGPAEDGGTTRSPASERRSFCQASAKQSAAVRTAECKKDLEEDMEDARVSASVYTATLFHAAESKDAWRYDVREAVGRVLRLAQPFTNTELHILAEKGSGIRVSRSELLQASGIPGAAGDAGGLSSMIASSAMMRVPRVASLQSVQPSSGRQSSEGEEEALFSASKLLNSLLMMRPRESENELRAARDACWQESREKYLGTVSLELLGSSAGLNAETAKRPTAAAVPSRSPWHIEWVSRPARAGVGPGALEMKLRYWTEKTSGAADSVLFSRAGILGHRNTGPISGLFGAFMIYQGISSLHHVEVLIPISQTILGSCLFGGPLHHLCLIRREFAMFMYRAGFLIATILYCLRGVLLALPELRPIAGPGFVTFAQAYDAEGNLLYAALWRLGCSFACGLCTYAFTFRWRFAVIWVMVGVAGVTLFSLSLVTLVGVYLHGTGPDGDLIKSARSTASIANLVGTTGVFLWIRRVVAVREAIRVGAEYCHEALLVWFRLCCGEGLEEDAKKSAERATASAGPFFTGEQLLQHWERDCGGAARANETAVKRARAASRFSSRRAGGSTVVVPEESCSPAGPVGAQGSDAGEETTAATTSGQPDAEDAGVHRLPEKMISSPSVASGGGEEDDSPYTMPYAALYPADFAKFQSGFLSTARALQQSFKSMNPAAFTSTRGWASANGQDDRSSGRTSTLGKSKCSARTISDLYAQADALNPVFQKKISEIAARVGVSFTYAPVKSETRALSKTVRLYGDDWRKLDDLCRASLVFDNLSELHDCYLLLARDPELVLLQTSAKKNRFQTLWNPALTSAYRDLQLSMQLRNAETEAVAGLSSHRCELQLHLSSFFVLKTAGQHAAYVTMRNLKGE